MKDTVVKMSKKGQVVIPKDIRDLLGLHEGDTIKIEKEGFLKAA